MKGKSYTLEVSDSYQLSAVPSLPVTYCISWLLQKAKLTSGFPQGLIVFPAQRPT